MQSPAGTSIIHTLALLSWRAENWEEMARKQQKQIKNLYVMGAALCMELSCEAGGNGRLGWGGKAEVAAVVPRGWFGIWGLVLLRYPFWSGQGCVISQH